MNVAPSGFGGAAANVQISWEFARPKSALLERKPQGPTGRSKPLQLVAPEIEEV